MWSQRLSRVGWDVDKLVPWRVWEMLDLDNFLVWKERFIVSRWCMAKCFEGMLDICVVGKLGRETLHLKKFFLQFFFWGWSLSRNMEIWTWKLKKCHIWIGNMYHVYTLFPDHHVRYPNFLGCISSTSECLTFVGEGIKASRCHAAMCGGEVTRELIGKTDEVAAVATLLVADKDKVPDWSRQKYREHQRSP